MRVIPWYTSVSPSDAASQNCLDAAVSSDGIDGTSPRPAERKLFGATDFCSAEDAIVGTESVGTRTDEDEQV